MESTTLLKLEIETLLTCPYPASLKKLERLLLHCTAADVQTWANNNPCSVKPLTLLVLQALGVWDYTQSVIGSLSSSQALQRAFLENDPLLLDASLNEVQNREESAQDTSVSEAMCVALLSYPLPGRVALPSSAQRLLTRLVERAIEAQTVSTLRPIYSILKGGPEELLDAMSTSTLDSFVDGIFKVLRNITDFESEPVYLYCLGILRTLAGLISGQVSISGTQPVASASTRQCVSPHKANSARAYFVGPKAQKTLQLVALQVMWAYKCQDSRDTTSISSSLEMAIDIAGCMDQATRAEWSQKNAPIVRKIVEKADKTDLPAGVRLAGHVFVGLLLAESRQLAAFKRDFGQEAFLAGLRAEEGGDSLCAALTQYVGIFAGVHDSQTLAQLLVHVLDTAMDVDGRSLQRMQTATTVVKAVAERTTTSQHIRTALIAVFAPSDPFALRDRLTRLTNYVERYTPSKIISNLEACDDTVREAFNTLIATFQHLVLTLLLLEGNLPLCISATDTLRLCSAVSPICTAYQRCEHAGWQPKRSRHFPQPPHDVGPPSQAAWTDRLRSALTRDMQARHSSVVELVNEVCEDLQKRCDGIEEPLRRERLLREELAEQCAMLQSEVQNAHSLIAEKEREHASHAAQEQASCERLAKAESTTSSLLGRMEELEQSLEDAKDSAQAKLQFVRDECDEELLLRKAEAAAALEDLAEARDTLKLTSQDLNDTKAKVWELEAQLEDERSGARILSGELESRLQSLTVSKEECHRMSVALEALRGSEATLTNRVGEQEQALTRNDVLIGELRQALEDAKTATAKQRQEWEVVHSHTVERCKVAERKAEEDHSRQLESLRSELERERADCKAARNDLTTAQQKYDQGAALLKETSKELRQTQSALEEARDMRKRLVQALGLPPGSGVPPPGTARRRSVRLNDRATLASAREPDSREPSSTIDKSFESAASSSGTPTPKRPKPRSSLSATSARAAHHVQVSVPSVKRPSKLLRARQPLGEASSSGNAKSDKIHRATSKAQTQTAIASSIRLTDFEADGLDFDENDLFSGTPYIPNATMSGDGDDGIFDETTADF